MKVIILAGGFGSRLSEYTDRIPKPMVEIGGKPILYHLMEIFSNYGHKNFYLALGYKSEVIVNFFKNLPNAKIFHNEDLSIVDNRILIEVGEWKINLINTGTDSMTGGRLKRYAKVTTAMGSLAAKLAGEKYLGIKVDRKN